MRNRRENKGVKELQKEHPSRGESVCKQRQRARGEGEGEEEESESERRRNDESNEGDQEPQESHEYLPRAQSEGERMICSKWRRNGSRKRVISCLQVLERRGRERKRRREGREREEGGRGRMVKKVRVRREKAVKISRLERCKREKGGTFQDRVDVTKMTTQLQHIGFKRFDLIRRRNKLFVILVDVSSQSK